MERLAASVAAAQARSWETRGVVLIGLGVLHGVEHLDARLDGVQVQACAELVASICRDFGIAAKDVVGHCDIALGRKTDPAGFDWEDFRARLAKAGIV